MSRQVFDKMLPNVSALCFSPTKSRCFSKKNSFNDKRKTNILNILNNKKKNLPNFLPSIISDNTLPGYQQPSVAFRNIQIA